MLPYFYAVYCLQNANSTFFLAKDLKPIFHLATLIARCEAKTRILQRGWLTLVGEKIRREQVGTVPTFFSVRANKFAKWKTGFKILV